MPFKTHRIVLILVLLIISGGCNSGQGVIDVTTAQDVIEQTQAEEWDIVILGDSDMWLSYEYYVPMFEEDLGVQINVHDEARPSTLDPVSYLKEDLDLREVITEAEIIVFNVPFVFPDVGGACFDQNLSFDESDCFDVTIQEYARSTKDVIIELKELAGDDGAMIRLQNMFVPTRYWERNMLLEERLERCFECFAAYWDAQAEIAAEENVPLVNVFSLFHGSDGDQDPYDLGYFGLDPLHVNEEGAKAIADLYRSVGYEYWLPEQ